ncbi:ABC-type transport auxiliary lipoprotein family protein [Piscinibacter sp.]|jgi:cholesterol transport system auxiliary component|uniref:ABC-type transport auxiliary lipoprotein family protein n=1 Tax=Piscinibacter sp. TaxID=1903157 RepID=UPI002F417680
MRTAAILVSLCVPMVSGCTLFSPVRVDTRTEILSRIPAQLPQGRARSASLLVLAPTTSAVYDTTQMAYAIQPYEVAYFSQNEWIETPSRMIHPLLVRTLQGTNAFSAVLVPPHMGRFTYALQTQILELKQDFTSSPPALLLALRFQLTRAGASEVIASKEVSLRESMRERTPYAGAVAANDAMANALQQLAEFVLANAG